MSRKPYPSDLTDPQWALVEPLLPHVPRRRRRGRPRKTELREVVNALFYHVREGCTWRALPHDLPPWKTAYNYFRAWDRDGTWQKLLDTLRPLARVKAGRGPMPRVAAIDSQSVKTATGGKQRGTDGGKKVQGRKRHILVDPLGFLIAVVVTAANVDDARAAQDRFTEVRGRDFPRLRGVFADGKYHNYAWYDWLAVHRRPYRLEIVRRPKGETAFQPLPVRWVVERTYAWQGRYRGLSKDYEHTPESSETAVRIAAIHHLLQRLRPKEKARSQRFRFKRRRRRVA
jgi:putative transposase